jgi:hypothetical protein
MQNPAKFREYAEECRRLAEQASGKNKATLLMIAEAWTNCAVEAERNDKLHANAKASSKPDKEKGSASSPDGD